MARMRAARGTRPPQPLPVAPPRAPGDESPPPSDPQALMRALPARILPARILADPGAAPCVVAPLRVEPVPPPSASITGSTGRLPGGLRFTLVGRRARGANVAPREPRIVVALRVPLGSAMTPFGADGPALAGTLGAGADAWNLLRVHLERDAAVLWEAAPYPAPPWALAHHDDGADDTAIAATLTRLLTAITWRVLRGDVRGGEAASLSAPRRDDAHHARSVSAAAALATRASVLLAQHPPPLGGETGAEGPALAAWVAATCNRALHGPTPEGALWPVARTGLWKDATNLRHQSLAGRLRELREDVFTQAAELVVVFDHPAGEHPGLRTTRAARWVEALGQGPAIRVVAPGAEAGEHPAVVALLRHPIARLDFRRPSATHTARTRAFTAADPPHPYAALVRAPMAPFPGFDAPPGPRDLPCRADAHGVPFDPEGIPPEALLPVYAAAPGTVRAPALPPSALDITRPGTGTAVCLVVQPFTYAVDHPSLRPRTAALDKALARTGVHNAARRVGGRGKRPDAFSVHRAAVERALLTPVSFLRAVPRTPGVSDGILSDVRDVLRGLATWAAGQHTTTLRGGSAAGVRYLTALPGAPPVAAAHAVEVLLRAGEVVARYGPPRVTVERRAAVGVPDGAPTLVVWFPVPAVDAHDGTTTTAVPWPVAAAEALVVLWHAVLLGPGLVWGPEAHGAALAALQAPVSPATRGLDPEGIPGFLPDAARDHLHPGAVDSPEGLATRVAMTRLRHRVAVGEAHAVDFPGAPARTDPAAPPMLDEALARGTVAAAHALLGVGHPVAAIEARLGDASTPGTVAARYPDPFAADALRLPAAKTPRYTGGSLLDRDTRLHVLRMALWPLAPGFTPRRVFDGLLAAPVPLPVVVAPGCAATVLAPRFRAHLQRTLREALYLTGYLRPASWRSVAVPLPGAVPCPFTTRFGYPVEAIPNARAVPSEGRRARLAVRGAMQAPARGHGFLNGIGAALKTCAASHALAVWGEGPHTGANGPVLAVPARGRSTHPAKAAVAAEVRRLDAADGCSEGAGAEPEGV